MNINAFFWNENLNLSFLTKKVTKNDTSMPCIACAACGACAARPGGYCPASRRLTSRGVLTTCAEKTYDRMIPDPKSSKIILFKNCSENMFAHVCIGSFLMLLNVSSLRFGICLQVQFSCVLASPWGAFVSRNLPFQG